MSKPWQDFWTFAFLVTSYLFTIGLCLHLLRRPGVSKAALVLAIWVVVVCVPHLRWRVVVSLGDVQSPVCAIARLDDFSEPRPSWHAAR